MRYFRLNLVAVFLIGGNAIGLSRFLFSYYCQKSVFFSIGMTAKQKYRSLNQLHDLLPLFFQPWWLDMVSNNWDVVLLEKAGAIVGLLPYCWERKIGLKILRNPSLTPYLGPLFFKDGLLVAYVGNDEQQAVLSEMWSQLPRFDSVDMETTVLLQDASFFEKGNYSVVKKLTYELSLEPAEEVIYSGFHNNHRKLIRLAGDCNAVGMSVVYLPEFLFWHEKTYSRKGKRYPYQADFVSQMVTMAIDRQCGQLLVAKNENQENAAFLFTVWDKEKMYLLMSAVNTDLAHHGAGRLLIWHAIKVAKAMGLKVFDFEGSMDERVGNIYKRFGGERKTYFCISKVNAIIWKLKKRLLG